MCENGTVQTDGIWVKVYGRALAEALQPVTLTGARMQPLNESSHYYGDVQQMRQMVCGVTAKLWLNRDAAGKRQTFHGEGRGGDPTSVQKRELRQRP